VQAEEGVEVSAAEQAKIGSFVSRTLMMEEVWLVRARGWRFFN
jgi:hypothetical protein